MSAVLTKSPESSAHTGPWEKPVMSGCRDISAQGCDSLDKDPNARWPWLLRSPWGYSVPELNSKSPEPEVVEACPRSRGCFGIPHVVLAGGKPRGMALPNLVFNQRLVWGR